MNSRPEGVWTRRATTLLLGSALWGCCHAPSTAPQPAVDTRHIDDTLQLAMAATGARGLAVSVVDEGPVVFS